jgi:hypothetical protein
MPRYFFHLRAGEQILWDDEGLNLPNPTAICASNEAARWRGAPWKDVLVSNTQSPDKMLVVVDEAGAVVFAAAL